MNNIYKGTKGFLYRTIKQTKNLEIDTPQSESKSIFIQDTSF